jgi:hypothetical protein
MVDAVAKIRLKNAKPLAALTPKHEQVLGLLVHGGDVGGPLSVNEVAERLKVRRAYVRDLLTDPLFKTKYNAALADARAALAPQAIAKIGELIEWKGEGKAADANVALNASKTALGEDAKGFSVNVQVNNQTNIANQIKPGYVLDLSALKPEPQTIEGMVE